MNDIITEQTIAQGDLVLIINNTKPIESGWWRKVEEVNYDKHMYYILEKPMHKDFNIHHGSIPQTHIENGLCVMKAETLHFIHDVPACKYYDYEKYDILLDVRGTEVIKLVQNNYNITSIDLCSPNVKCSDKFMTFMKYYNIILNKNLVNDKG